MAIEKESSENRDIDRNIVGRRFPHGHEAKSRLRRFAFNRKYLILVFSLVLFSIANIILFIVSLPGIGFRQKALINIFLLVLAIYFLLPVAMYHADFITDSLEQLAKSVKNSVYVTSHTFSQTGSQEEGTEILCEAIDSNDPNIVKMIEYSSGTVNQVVNKALNSGAHVKLLLKSPKTMNLDEDDWREEYVRLRNSLTRYCDNFSNSDNLHIRFYEENATLRGRKIGNDVINVGWYTFDDRSGGITSVWGPQNPTIFLYDEDHENYSPINEFFEQVFEDLWESGTTVKTYCCQEQDYSDELGDKLLPLLSEEEFPTKLSHRLKSNDQRQDWVEEISSDCDQETAP